MTNTEDETVYDNGIVDVLTIKDDDDDTNGVIFALLTDGSVDILIEYDDFNAAEEGVMISVEDRARLAEFLSLNG